MALIGSIIGDIIGSRFEFPSQRPDNLDWKHIPLFHDTFSEYTDDTVMSIATKYALDHYRGDFARAYREFGKKYPDAGYGDKFFHWIQTPNAAPYESWGNGSAMRVSYIGDVVQDIGVYALAKQSALCTHNSPSGVRGAFATAGIIAMGNNHATKEEMYEVANKIYKDNCYDCSQSLDEIREVYAWNETCDGTVPIAIRCFLESEDYESCVRNCLSLPCDMDTMCCIAGGIAEAFYGTTGLDNETILKKYLDTYLYDCIKDIIY